MNSLEEQLIAAAKNGKTSGVKDLLERGADIHAHGDYALRWAAYLGNTETVKLLLDYGADIHANEDEALKWATENGHTETVRLLLDRGANIAAHYGHTETLAVLNAHLTKTKTTKFELVETTPLKGIRISVTADTSWLL